MQRLLISSYAGLALLGPGPAAVHQPDRGTRCRLDSKMESIMKSHSMRIVRGHCWRLRAYWTKVQYAQTSKLAYLELTTALSVAGTAD
jgi:hypothetical protein